MLEVHTDLHVALHVKCLLSLALTNISMCQHIFILLPTIKCNGNPFSSEICLHV